MVERSVAVNEPANPSYTPDQVYNALKSSADLGTLGRDDYGWGRIDAASTLDYFRF